MARIEDQRRDVAIGGAGFAGLALAIALRQALGETFSVTVVDPALASAQSKDPRASAIAAAARRLFEAIEVWDAVADKAQPILDMVVTDSKLDDAVRPTFLTFGGDVEEGEPFAHMVENRHLVDALVAKARDTRRRSARRHGQRFCARGKRDRGQARKRRHCFRAASGRRRRRALAHPRTGRHRLARLELRSVGDCHDRRA